MMSFLCTVLGAWVLGNSGLELRKRKELVQPLLIASFGFYKVTTSLELQLRNRYHEPIQFLMKFGGNGLCLLPLSLALRTTYSNPHLPPLGCFIPFRAVGNTGLLYLKRVKDRYIFRKYQRRRNRGLIIMQKSVIRGPQMGDPSMGVFGGRMSLQWILGWLGQSLGTAQMLLISLPLRSCQCVGEASFKLDTEVSLLESHLGEVVAVPGYFFRLSDCCLFFFFFLQSKSITVIVYSL